MNDWIDIKERLPDYKQKVFFKLHGYKYEGIYYGQTLDGMDPIFYGNQGKGGRLTTIEASHWISME